YTVQPWVGAELAGIYAAASLIVARAGAGTVNECCQLGLPALYIPLPGPRGDEQTANARWVARGGGSAILPQATLTNDLLLERIRTLLAEPARLKEMGERARGLAIPDAAERPVPAPFGGGGGGGGSTAATPTARDRGRAGGRGGWGRVGGWGVWGPISGPPI